MTLAIALSPDRLSNWSSVDACLRIQPGRSGQATEAAELIYSADPTQFDYVFGSAAQSQLASGWTSTHGLYSHSLASCCVSGQQLVGLELGYLGERHGSLMTDTKHRLFTGPNVAGSRALDFASILLPRIPPGVYYIQFLAVSERHRGCGLGSQLLREAIRKAARLGAWAVHIDVAASNRCLGLYERLGLRLLCRTTMPERFGFEENLRLELRLEPDRASEEGWH